MTTTDYLPSEIEEKWQERWAQERIFEPPTDIAELQKKPKAYVLDMFPYPSGDGLHVGHPKGYTATDAYARMKRMQGFHVLHPMGWDAFGLPAERAAQRSGQDVAEMTERNINNFRRQIKSLGLSYDWTRELATTDPDYYQWTQWIFLKLYEQGLAYKATVPVNWCPALETVLANEEVKNGRYVDTGDPVEVREMEQWMLAITKYADRLLADLDTLDWPEGLKKQQRDWIGRSEGLAVDFHIPFLNEDLKIFTSRPETLYGATFCVVAVDHPFARRLLSEDRYDELDRVIHESKLFTDEHRVAPTSLGIDSGRTCIHPLTGEELPIYIAPYVLSAYGTGAIMAVPAHDDRDQEFAEAHSINVITVIDESRNGHPVMINSADLNGLSIEDAREAISNQIGTREVHYKLRDWLFSRQRYWGEPFPMMTGPDGKIIPVPESDLPILLPAALDGEGTGLGFPLDKAADDWKFVELPDGTIAARELNTMPQWAGSCWYYLRFIDPNNADQPWDKPLENYWMPVDLYVGGAEHAVQHLLYARFWHKVFYDLGLVSTAEPFQRLLNQGMVTAESFQDADGKYYRPEDVHYVDGVARSISTNKELVVRVEKMSKSKLNVVNPDDVVQEHGADAMRLYEMFMGPLTDGGPWSTQSMQGMTRFLRRVHRIYDSGYEGDGQVRIVLSDLDAHPQLAHLRSLLDQTIEAVTANVESVVKLNTAISRLMEFSSAVSQAGVMSSDIADDFIKLVAQFAPHLAEEIWHGLGHETFVSLETWPEPKNLRHDISAEITVAVQIGGKIRGHVNAPVGLSQDDLCERVLRDEHVLELVGNRPVDRAIVVPDKLVNLVLGGD
jgi:leucyl-tRNA synthetase